MNEKTFIDLFAGIGGFHLGITKADNNRFLQQRDFAGNRDIKLGEIVEASGLRNNSGLRCVWANEWDKYAASIYRRNFPETPLSTDDIRKVPADAIPDHDLLCAGFPCQSFSVAGKRRGFEEARGTLFFEIARVAEHKRPRLLLLENVKGLLSHDGGRTFWTMLRILGELDYYCEWQVLNSKWFGVPQNRERVFIVGHLGGEPQRTVFPITETGESPHGGDAEEQVANALQSPGHASGNYRGMTMIADQPFMIVDGYNQTVKREIDVVKTNEASPTSSSNLILRCQNSEAGAVVDYNAPTLRVSGGSDIRKKPYLVQPVLTPDRPKKRQQGRRFKDTGEEMFTLTGTDIHGIAYPEISNSLDTSGYLREMGNHEIGKYGLTDYRIRRLTPLECERLQGFPDGFTEFGYAKGKTVDTEPIYGEEKYVNDDGEEDTKTVITGYNQIPPVADAIRVSDTQRYRCLGNAVTVNVIMHLAKRLAYVMEDSGWL